MCARIGRSTFRIRAPNFRFALVDPLIHLGHFARGLCATCSRASDPVATCSCAVCDLRTTTTCAAQVDVRQRGGSKTQTRPLPFDPHKKHTNRLEKLAALDPTTRVGGKEEAILPGEQKANKSTNQGERDLYALHHPADRPPPLPASCTRNSHLIAQTLFLLLTRLRRPVRLGQLDPIEKQERGRPRAQINRLVLSFLVSNASAARVTERVYDSSVSFLRTMTGGPGAEYKRADGIRFSQHAPASKSEAASPWGEAEPRDRELCSLAWPAIQETGAFVAELLSVL